MRWALVLGAGGATGHGFHAGTLAALHDVCGLDARDATLIVGTSAGAAAGALIRAGLSGLDLAARACGEAPSAAARRVAELAGPPLHVVDHGARRGVRDGGLSPASTHGLLAALTRPWQARIGTFGAAALPPGRIDTEVLAAPYRRLFGDAWCDAALWLCAVRLDDGRRTVFRGPARGVSVASAVAASCAVPALFAPVLIDGTRYVDGGVWSPTNADLVAAETLLIDAHTPAGADTTTAASAGSSRRPGAAAGMRFDAVVISSPMSSAPSLSWRSDAPMRQLHHWYVRSEAAALHAAGIPVLLVEPTAPELASFASNPLDSARRADVTRRARELVATRLRTGDLAAPARLAGLSPR